MHKKYFFSNVVMGKVLPEKIYQSSISQSKSTLSSAEVRTKYNTSQHYATE